jgi:hypothetical protein
MYLTSRNLNGIRPTTLYTLDGRFHQSQTRRQFIEDLITYVKSMQSELDEIMILMDANEQLGISTQVLTYLLRECKLVDFFHQHHVVCPAFTT